MKSSFWMFVFFLAINTISPLEAALAQSRNDKVYAERLSPEQVQRVEKCHQAVAEVDKKSVAERIADLESTALAEENLQILEAMTVTYTEVVAEQKVVKPASRKRLWSMIELNMAYLQLGGVLDPDMIPDPLNQLICRKLRKHLAENVLNNPELFQKLS